MMYCWFWILLATASPAFGYGDYFYPDAERPFEGQYDFSGCDEVECWSGRFRGFGCSQGRCEYVCLGSSCTFGDREFVSIAPTDTNHATVSSRVSKTTAKVENRFPGCYGRQCRSNGAYGFGCLDGTCEYVCKDKDCYYDAKIGKTTHHGHRSHDRRILFTNCDEPQCTYSGYFGFDCIKGDCQFICKDDYCDYNRGSVKAAMTLRSHRKKASNRVRTNSKFQTPVRFVGCRTSKCQNQQLKGYYCKDGLCSVVCKQSHCWRNLYFSPSHAV
uniref:Tenascin-C n=1 Tax=Spirometra erinaceieuropaei TaxID=99802 RepID=I6SCC1_SPIER|nr:tenascin-C [Spirometra erinaceieuropaei]